MTNNNAKSAHVLIFPYPAQGHMLPLLDFTHQLALRCDGCDRGLRSLTITILVTPKNLPILNPLLSQRYSSSVIVQTLVLPFPTHHSIPQGVENVKDLPPSYFGPMMRAMGELYHPILHWFRSHSSPPSVIISDFFLGWTHHLACELSIPRIVFCPSGALTLAISACLWCELPKRDDPNDQNAIVSFPRVPNCPSYPWWQLSPLYRAYKEGKEGDPYLEFIRNCMLANYASWGMVFNSFNELEGIYLEHLKKDLGHQRVWGVGPLLIPDSSSSKLEEPNSERGGSSSVVASDVLSWLDTCYDGSVVYVCFGSQAVLNNMQMEELATGLDQSGVRFIWSVKEATIGHVSAHYGMVPQWFEDKHRLKRRGLLIKGWAPQVLILKHRAVGSFLTHCGWNSVMEAVVAGVPMLAWPMGADQYMNTTLLVDQMKVAVRVCEGEETVPNAAELTQVLAESVTISRSSSSYPDDDNNSAAAASGMTRRRRAMELSKAAMHAVKEGGTSFKDLDALVNSLFGAE